MAKQRDDYDNHDDAGWFCDQLRQRDREIAALRRQKDELTDLVRRFEEYVEDCNGVLEAWKQTSWTLGPFRAEHNDLVNRYLALAKRHNKLIPLVYEQDVGRPLKADELEVEAVTRLHKAGRSLRWIAEETELSLRTVRTIVGRINRTDRTTRKRWVRLGLDPKELAQSIIETGHELVNEAKGLGRGAR
jgi:hypothetical protein